MLALLRKLLKADPPASYSFAASKVHRGHHLKLDRATVRRWALRQNLAPDTGHKKRPKPVRRWQCSSSPSSGSPTLRHIAGLPTSRTASAARTARRSQSTSPSRAALPTRESPGSSRLPLQRFDHLWPAPRPLRRLPLLFLHQPTRCLYPTRRRPALLRSLLALRSRSSSQRKNRARARLLSKNVSPLSSPPKTSPLSRKPTSSSSSFASTTTRTKNTARSTPPRKPPGTSRAKKTAPFCARHRATPQF